MILSHDILLTPTIESFFFNMASPINPPIIAKMIVATIITANIKGVAIASIDAAYSADISSAAFEWYNHGKPKYR